MAGLTVLLVVLGAAVAAVVLGVVLARVWRAKESRTGLTVLLLCLLVGLAVMVTGWPPRLGSDLGGGTVLVYDVLGDVPLAQPPQADQPNAEEIRAKVSAMDNLVAAVARRVNPGGVREVTIRPYGPKQLQLILPDTDPQEIARVKRLLSSPGTLEFHVLANQRDDKALIEKAVAEKGSEVRSEQGRLQARWVPVAKGQASEIEKYPEIAQRSAQRNGQTINEVLVLADQSNVTGASIVQATPLVGANNKASVQYHLDPAGGQQLGILTGNKLPDAVGSFTRKLAIMIDGQLYAAPPIKEAMSQDGDIAGNFTEQQAKDLADVLNAHALPKALSSEPVSQQTVGPLLGRDTVLRTAAALGAALAVVLVLLVVYYRVAGLMGAATLLLNMLMVVAIMTLIKTAFTLPALAGLLLAFAISLYAHVLVFERIREELDRQTALRMAIRNAFGKAQDAILDIGAVILIMASVFFLLGTEQVKVFAVPLWLGTALSWVSAIYGSRVLFELAERRRWITGLSFMGRPTRPDANRLAKRWLPAVVSSLAVVLSLVGLFLLGPSLLGFDFQGGVAVEPAFKQPQSIVEVRRALSALPEVAVADLKASDAAPGHRFLVTASTPPGETTEKFLPQVQSTLQKAFDDRLDKGPKPAADKASVLEGKPVGARVTSVTRDQAFYAILVSLALIFGYLWLRFRRINFGLTALVALAHDLVITVGLVVLSNYLAAYLGFLLLEPFKIGVPVVVALLVIAGLSLAGTIVLLDRLREAQGKMQILTDEKANLSFNQALPRILVASLAMVVIGLALYVAGGPGVHAFAFTLLVGTIVAAYSPTSIAGPFLLWMGRPAVNVESPTKPAAPQRTAKGRS